MLPCTQPVDCTCSAAHSGRDGIVDGDAIGPGGGGKADVAIACFAREGDDGQAGVAGFQGGDDLRGGFGGEIGEILAL